MNHYLTTTTEQFCSCFQKGAKIALALHFWYRKFGLISYLSNAQLKTISDYNCLLVSLWFLNSSCDIIYCSDWLSVFFALIKLVEKAFYQRHTTKHFMGSGCNEIQKQFLRFKKKFLRNQKSMFKKTKQKAATTNKRQNR